MVLSSTGLVENNATTLRVLKNGQLVDVLTLTAGGSPDLPLGGLSIAQTAGLQSQLNAKATTAALSAAVGILGSEIDVLEAGVTAVGVAVASLGAAVATKASQAALDATTTTVATKASQSGLDAANASVSALSGNLNTVSSSLNANFNTLSSLLGTRASQASVTASLALKQDLIWGGSLSRFHPNRWKF